MQKEENKEQKNKAVSPHKSGERFVPPPRPQLAQKQAFFQDEAETVASEQKNADVQEDNKRLEEKPLKQKKEKTPKTSQQKAQIKKWSIIGAAILFVVIGITIAFALIAGNAKRNVPLVILQEGNQLSLIKTEEEYFLAAPYQAHADLYYFEIKNNLDQSAPILEIKSKENLISATGIFSNPGTYQVRFAIQKENRISTKSEFSAWVVVSSAKKLQTPIFEYDSNLKQFSWQEVSEADAYKLFYFKDEMLKSIVITQFESNNGLIAVNLKDLNLDLGIYEFTLIAINTNSELYVPSDFNTKIKVENIEELKSVESGVYNIATGKLSVVLKEFKDNLKLKISYGENQSIIINIFEEGLEHTFDLTKYNGLAFDATDTIEVSLVSADEFVSESNKVKVSISN